MTCERIRGNDGTVRMQCKEADQCFQIGSRKANGDGGPRGRYFLIKREAQERVCFVCASPDHDAHECPCVPCKRCFNSFESHKKQTTLCSDFFQKDFLSWLSSIDKNSLIALTCISCGKKEHADCTRAFKPRSKTCMSCGNMGHYCTRCNVRVHSLQVNRDRLALEATSPDVDAIVSMPLDNLTPGGGSRKKRPFDDSDKKKRNVFMKI